MVVGRFRALTASHPSRVRGLKCSCDEDEAADFIVAPFTGAWIEIQPASGKTAFWKKSHPSRVRGLKFFLLCTKNIPIISSHPSRVRGLKSRRGWLAYFENEVAPFTGAWIEIFVEMLDKSFENGRTLHGCMD